MAKSTLLKSYEQLNKQEKYYSEASTALIDEIFESSIMTLRKFDRIPLTSKVPKKTYFAYKRGKKLSRPINQDLFEDSAQAWENLRRLMTLNRTENNITAGEISKTIYSIAISFCAAIDLLKDGDQKTPGTYFERLMAYFFAWRVGVEPKTQIQVSDIDDERIKLKTDFIFDLGPHKRKFHMPVKISTRERGIMFWADQRLLDGVYGMERYMGTAILLTETKLDVRKREVVEICVPGRWRLYQLYVSKLKRIYYLDLPVAYAKLWQEFPPLAVKSFGEFFTEWDELTPI